MRFADPFCLLLLIPAFLAAAAAHWWTEPSRAALPFPDGESFAGRSAASGIITALPTALKAAALLLAVLALARPQIVLREVRSLTHGIDIMITLDTSTSMHAIDYDPLDRISAAKQTAANFIAGRTSDRIGLIVFGGSPIMACPLTMDYSAILELLQGVDAGMTQTDGTAIGDAIASAVNHLKSSRAKSKIIILLTDGANNAGIIDPITAAKTAATFGIKIYTIGTAKRGPAYVPVDTPMGRQLAQIPDELDEDELTQIAYLTGGKYYRAATFQELKNIYADIDQLEKTDITRPTVVSYTDLYPWLVLPALLLLGAELLLSRTLLLRLP